MGRYNHTPQGKYDTPYFEENPDALARQKQMDVETRARIERFAEEREKLRIRYSEQHRESCPAFKAHRIPFESCGMCRKAFDDAVEVI